MNIITIDFETYYDRQYSLSKLTTEEYIRNEDFEVIGVGVKLNDLPAVWFTGSPEDVHDFLLEFPWEDSIAVAHNAMFDAAILTWVFQIKPAIWFDTMSAARAIDGPDVSVSLKSCAERHGVGVKGTEVVAALGMRRLHFSEESLAQYGEYCKNDCEITFPLFLIYAEKMSATEIKLIDLTIRMFSEPVLELDLPLLEQHLDNVVTRKEELLAACEADKEILNSNPKFAELLRSLGVEPPMKTSPATGKETYAFAKNDQEFLELADHHDERVQAVVAARLGTKSTLEETRTQRFIDIAKRGLLPVPLRYYAAHTGRWGGGESLNLQNLPSRGDNTLKRAIRAPEGYVVIDCDSSQIEARVLAWLAGQVDLVDQFAQGKDVYKFMASKIYNKPVEEITKEERFMGKTVVLGCFGPDTQVLTDSGWKAIVCVKPTDMLWDGVEWVSHQGVVPQGVKNVIGGHGIWATADHEILTEHGWREWREVCTSHTLFQSAINKGNLLSSTGHSTTNPVENQRDGTPLSDVLVGGKVELTAIISRRGVLRDAIPALNYLVTQLENAIGGTKVSYPKNAIELGYLTAFLHASKDAITQMRLDMPIMEGVEFTSTMNGEKTKRNFCDTYLSLKGGIQRVTNSIELTLIEGMSRVIYGLQHAQKTLKTVEKYQSCSKKLMTYDIAYAGPRNRYTVATDAGPIIVHNCGYGLGHVKFQGFLKLSGIDLSLEECKGIIDIYRSTSDRIVALWKQGQNTLEAMFRGETCKFGTQPQAIYIDADTDGTMGFRLPSGYMLKYAGLQKDSEGQFSYQTRNGRTKIYGGKVVENVVQALARCVVGEQIVMISARYRPVITVHDAVGIIAPQHKAKSAQKYVEACMRTAPDWAAGLPVNCESGIGETYGDC